MKLIKIEQGPKKGTTVERPKGKGHLSIESKNLSSIKDWKVGETYQVLVTVKQTGVREADEWDIREGRANIDDIRADFQVLEYEAYEDKKEDKSS